MATDHPPANSTLNVLARVRDLALSPAEQRNLIAWLAGSDPDSLAAGLDLIVSERPPALDLAEYDALLAQLNAYTPGDLA